MRIYVFLVILLVLSGCATSIIIDSTAQNGQLEIYQEGRKFVVSSKKSLVAVSPQCSVYKSDERPVLGVVLQNNSSGSFNFSAEDIQVIANNKNIRIVTYGELVDEIKNKKMWDSLAGAFVFGAMAGSASRAGYTNYSGNYSTTYSNGVSGHGVYSGTSYNPAQAQLAQAAVNLQAQSYGNALDARANQSFAQLNQAALRKTTVFPGQFYGGSIVLENMLPPDGVSELNVLVNAGGESHEFKFRQFTVSK